MGGGEEEEAGEGEEEEEGDGSSSPGADVACGRRARGRRAGAGRRRLDPGPVVGVHGRVVADARRSSMVGAGVRASVGAEGRKEE